MCSFRKRRQCVALLLVALLEPEALFDVVLPFVLESGGVELLEDDEELLDDEGVVGFDGVDECDDGGVVGGVDDGSSRGGLVGLVLGMSVPGGMYVPGGIGVPGGSTTDFPFVPGAGTSVTIGVPSGPTVTTAVGDVAGSGCGVPSVVWPGTALPWMTSGPEEPLLLPALMSPPAFVDGVASSAIPPNAVASTTPLTASRRYPLRFTREDESRGGEISVRTSERDPDWAMWWLLRGDSDRLLPGLETSGRGLAAQISTDE